jgi:hypothetical protein
MKMKPRVAWFHNQCLCVQLIQQGKETTVIMIVPVDSINMMPSERPQRHTAAICQYGSGKSMGICGLMFLHLMQVMWKHRLQIKQVTLHDSVIMHQLFLHLFLCEAFCSNYLASLHHLHRYWCYHCPIGSRIGPRLHYAAAHYAAATFLVSSCSCSVSFPTHCYSRFIKPPVLRIGLFLHLISSVMGDSTLASPLIFILSCYCDWLRN